MRSLSTGLTAATASALAALAVTVAVPALGDDATPDNEQAIRACLKDRGAVVPEGDGRALKMWIIGSRTDAERDAIKACGLADAPKPEVHGGPDEAQLRSCLKDHGVDVADPDLKRWVIGDHTAAEKAALKACGLVGVAKPAKGAGACGEKAPREPADGAKPTARARSVADPPERASGAIRMTV